MTKLNVSIALVKISITWPSSNIVKLAEEKLGLSLTASTVKSKFLIVVKSPSETAIDISKSIFCDNSISTVWSSASLRILFSIINHSGNNIELNSKSSILLSTSLI